MLELWLPCDDRSVASRPDISSFWTTDAELGSKLRSKTQQLLAAVRLMACRREHAATRGYSRQGVETRNAGCFDGVVSAGTFVIVSANKHTPDKSETPQATRKQGKTVGRVYA